MASAVGIEVRREDETLILVVSDDGCGLTDSERRAALRAATSGSHQAASASRPSAARSHRQHSR